MAPPQEERVRQLLRKREGFRQELEAFRTLLNNHEEGTPVHAIQRNLQDIEGEFASFKKGQCELDDRDEGQTLKDRVDLQQKFYTIAGQASAILEEAKKQAEPTTTNLATKPSDMSLPEPVDLPRIQLPTFSGAYEDWPGFADQFRSTVHDNPRIDDCKRLMYLRSCLKHGAALAIASLSNAAANYAVAWEILERRYNRPAKIVERHLQEIFDAASSSRIAHRDLQSYTTKLEAHYKALAAIGQPTADALLLHLCTANLDRETDSIWKEKIRSTPFPTFPDFLQFLNDRCQVIEPARTTRPPRGQAFVTSRSPPLCPICHGPHKIWRCNTFRTKTIDERILAAEEISACTNCLLPGHKLQHCTSGSCRICDQRHHTLLHRSDAPMSNQTPPTTPPRTRKAPSYHPNNPSTGPDLRLQKTRFGWVIGGSPPSPGPARVFHASTTELETDLTRFWELDEGPQIKHLSEADRRCEEHFQNHVQRTSDGRYIVALPFNDKISSLGSSKAMAMKRLASLQQQFRRNQQFETAYRAVIQEYLDLGHMTKVASRHEPENDYYLPHHGVVKDSSTSTKLRVVFDGSAPSTTGVSLKDTLYTGPKLQEDLFDILLRF
ncbi:uncharacterized protein LOC143304844 [Bombus vancouverensis nearcticus]|uniref:uncharacterized protein LOC143304167 n=1 Tax=Bombus vancouverensis nearcticus TaxID=2705178 RepID=UPI00402B094E